MSKFTQGSFFSWYKVSQSSRSPLPSPRSTTGSLVEGLPGDGGASDHIHLHVRGLFGSHPFGLSILVRFTKHKESKREKEADEEEGDIAREKETRTSSSSPVIY